MMKPRPPEGMTEEDYEAIEAAVMETVRGRWFLAEFARRSHVDEMRQMLDAVARLEQVVTSNHAPADPSIRLLVQRLKEVGGKLGGLVADMRAEGVDEAFCAGIEAQARALGGLLRLNGASEGAKPRLPQPERALPIEATSRAALLAPLPPPPEPVAATFEQRLAALAAIEQMPSLEKIRLFA